MKTTLTTVQLAGLAEQLAYLNTLHSARIEVAEGPALDEFLESRYPFDAVELLKCPKHGSPKCFARFMEYRALGMGVRASLEACRDKDGFNSKRLINAIATAPN